MTFNWHIRPITQMSSSSSSLTNHGPSVLDYRKPSRIIISCPGIGIYAPDAEAYEVFAELFDPVIGEENEDVSFDDGDEDVEDEYLKCSKSRGVPRRLQEDRRSPHMRLRRSL